MNLRVILHIFALCTIGIFSSLCAAEIYRVINSDGTISYSDQPPSDGAADQVTLPDLFILPSVKVPEASTPNSVQKADIKLKSIRIHSPMDEEVIRGPDNRLNIVVSVTPSIDEGERLQLFHNGVPYGSAQSSGQWALARLAPGTQKFSVQLVTTEGEIHGQSSTFTVYVIL